MSCGPQAAREHPHDPRQHFGDAISNMRAWEKPHKASVVRERVSQMLALARCLCRHGLLAPDYALCHQCDEYAALLRPLIYRLV